MNRAIKFRAWNGKQWVTHVFTRLITNGDIRHPVIAIKNDDTITIQQFTGLTDKNGKEIFEGDICSTFSGNNIIVEFIDAQFVMSYSRGNYRPFAGYGNMKYVEVIGNIFENPEFLK